MIKYVFRHPVPDDEQEWGREVSEAIFIMNLQANMIAAQVSKIFASDKPQPGKKKPK